MYRIEFESNTSASRPPEACCCGCGSTNRFQRMCTDCGVIQPLPKKPKAYKPPRERADGILRQFERDIRRQYRDEFGWTLPDSEKGRERRDVLLRVIASQGGATTKRLANAATLLMSMPSAEAERLADGMLEHGPYYDARRPKELARILGEESGLTVERWQNSKLRIHNLLPAGVTEADIAERRKALGRARSRAYRARHSTGRRRGRPVKTEAERTETIVRRRPKQAKAARARRTRQVKPRAPKPWLTEGISRATWYRRRETPVRRKTSPEKCVTNKIDSLPRESSASRNKRPRTPITGRSKPKTSSISLAWTAPAGYGRAFGSAPSDWAKPICAFAAAVAASAGMTTHRTASNRGEK